MKDPTDDSKKNLPKDVIGLIAENTDNPTLSSLSQVSTLFKSGTEIERIHRLFSIARQGGLEEVKLALQEGTSQEWLKALLTRTVEMGWEDRAKEDGTVEVKQHRDTLLQLAYRMRDQEMFDVVKAELNKLDPEVWIQQIKDFEGEQADCLDEMAEAYAANLTHLVRDDVDLAIKGIGGAQLRCFKNMPWVMHRMRHEDSGWNEGLIDKPFKRDVKDLSDFCRLKRFGGGLGITWVGVGGGWLSGGVVRLGQYDVWCEAVELDRSVVAELKSKCVSETTEVERIHRLFSIARQGGLEEVKSALKPDGWFHKGTSEQSRLALLTRTVEMGWEDRAKEDGTVEVKLHSDTLLQLAWRMRDKEMFDVVKAGLDKLDPAQWKQQMKAFEGEQADCLTEMAEAYARGVAAWRAENDDLAIKGIGGAQLRCFKNMPWVMHRMRHEDSGWNEGLIDKPFKRDVKGLSDFCGLKRFGGGLGITWCAIGGIWILGGKGWGGFEGGRARIAPAGSWIRWWCGWVRDERDGNVIEPPRLLVTALKWKCVSETQAIQSQLSESKPAQT